MEEGRCPTCESLVRKPLSATLLQVATLQAHLRACDLRPPGDPPAPHAHDASLASRALAAKRRKSVASFKLSLPPDEFTSPASTSTATSIPATTPDENSRMLARRNTWCYASGTSAVAIDNKIEQAMDLVKSHLMFAVREEVEVLKERIAELMERITQLEVENTYLRSHASQDTLAQLPAPGAKPAPLPPAGPPPPAS